MPNQTIYEKMSRQRLEIAAAQIDILDYFDSKNKERRTQELYNVLHEALIKHPSEISISEMDKLIQKYNRDIAFLRRKSPSVESTYEVRKKIRELEYLLTAFSN